MSGYDEGDAGGRYDDRGPPPQERYDDRGPPPQRYDEQRYDDRYDDRRHDAPPPRYEEDNRRRDRQDDRYDDRRDRYARHHVRYPRKTPPPHRACPFCATQVRRPPRLR